MNASPFSQQPPKDEVIRVAQPFQFAIVTLGAGVVLLLIAMGGLMAKFPATQNGPLWVGVWVTVFVLGLVFHKFFLDQRQLQLGLDRLRIVNEQGKVTLEIPYAAMASLQLFKKTTLQERQPDLFNPFEAQDLAVQWAKESLKGVEVATVAEETLLGIRFEDGFWEQFAPRQLAKVAAARGSAQGYDFTIRADVYAIPLRVIEEKIRLRWQPYRI